MVPKNRTSYKVRKIPLSEEGTHSDFKELTPSERVAMVWQMTAQAWTFKEGTWDEPRLRRDIVRVLRNRGEGVDKSKSKDHTEPGTTPR